MMTMLNSLMAFRKLKDKVLSKKKTKNRDQFHVIFTGRELLGEDQYEYYKADSISDAQKFLRSKQPLPEHTCLIVETPAGTWGLNSNGPFIQQSSTNQTLSEQTDLSTIQCEPVSITPLLTNELLTELLAGVEKQIWLDICCGSCREPFWGQVRVSMEGLNTIDFSTHDFICIHCGAKNHISATEVLSLFSDETNTNKD